MASIWVSSGEGWDLLPPTGFPDERTLHALVERSPELLPLAGAPQLVVLGREVPLGGGYADLLAVEPPGRLVLIEVKLAANAEARRAVQIFRVEGDTVVDTRLYFDQVQILTQLGLMPEPAQA